MDNIYVTKSSMPEFDEYVEEIKSLWETHKLTNMGDKHKLFEKQLKQYLDVDNIELLVNGHMGIELVLQAMNLQGEVLTTPFTFASTTHAIIRNNLEPVFCDINPTNYTIDPNDIEKHITDRTCAILPVHVYGNVCDVESIESIARKYGLKVIYDAAHVFGVKYKGKTVGQFGDASCFSFHATKVFNSIEGGAVCYRDKKVGNALYELKNFGIHGPEEVSAVGANAKMNEFAAAMGICNLRHINEEIIRRKNVYDRYVELLEGIDGVRVNKVQDNVETNYSYFVIVVDETKFGSSRNEVFDALAKEKIHARKYFYPLTSEFSCFHGKYDTSKTPVAAFISKRVLALPMYASLEIEIVDKICDIIKNCKK